VLLAECEQRRRQKLACRGAHEADGELLDLSRARNPCGTLCLVQQAATLDQERLAGRSESNAPTCSLEEANAELVFEAPNLMAQRRLRDAKSSGGATEVELFCNRDEVLHQAQIELGQCAEIDRANLLIRGQAVLDVRASRA
jgi:hypothetical protein